MKQLFVILFICIGLFASAGQRGLPQLPYVLQSSEVDLKLSEFESVYEFNFNGISDPNFIILYSIDGVDGQSEITSGSRLTFCTKPGKHIFQFFTWHYEEIFTDSLEIKSTFRDIYDVNLQSSQSMMPMSKPVIYLYPSAPTKISVEVDIFGENQFYYPYYNGSWECTALPNGEIHVGDKSYNYLFWEADAVAPTLIHREGFNVTKNEVLEFLEGKLTAAGLTSKEQADFITYWAPRMIQNELNFVQFMFNEDCNEFAELNITPKPDQLYRIYMLWEPTDQFIEVEQQQIVPINREGFTVLEWGGMELPAFTANQSL